MKFVLAKTLKAVSLLVAYAILFSAMSNTPCLAMLKRPAVPDIRGPQNIIIIDDKNEIEKKSSVALFEEDKDKKRKRTNDLIIPQNKKIKTVSTVNTFSPKSINLKQTLLTSWLGNPQPSPSLLNKQTTRVVASEENKPGKIDKKSPSVPKNEFKIVKPIIKDLNKGRNQAPIDIEPLLQTRSNDAKKETDLSLSSSKKSKLKTKKRKKEKPKPKPKCKVSHIRGKQEHIDLLQEMLDSANDEIVLTTQSVTWLPNEIYDSLMEAVDRQVKIHIVYNNNIPDKVAESFENNNIRCEQNTIHTKCLIVDKKKCVFGSYNWLDFTKINEDSSDSNIDDIADCSFKISKNDCYVKRLRGKIYSEIIANRKGPSEKKEDFLEFKISDRSRMKLLTTLYDHEKFFIDACREAKQKIEIHSPFVTYKNATVRLNNIAKNLNENVKLYLVVGEYFNELNGFIKRHSILSKNTKIRLDEDFHRKTLIIDKETISEGSFNWLSSASNLESDYHNQDTSLVLQGRKAKRIIKEDDSLFMH
jgi:hypothetical protein